MRMIHPAAWVGLFLNVILAFMFFQALATMDLSTMEAAHREAWWELQDFILGTIRPFYMTLLLLQAAALFLLLHRKPFALPLAFISGLLTVPVGFVYLMGCLLTHYQLKYAYFPPVPPTLIGSVGARHIFPSGAARKMRLLTISASAAFAVLFLLGSYNLAATFFALSWVGLYCAMRAAKNHALVLYDDGLTLTPGLLSPALWLPYANITLATLYDNASIEFEVSAPGGPPQFLVWPLRTLDPAQSREAIEELGAALHARGVPLQ